MNDKYILGMFGIGALVVLEAIALYTGLDGAMFGTVVAGIGSIIGGIVGYEYGKKGGKEE